MSLVTQYFNLCNYLYPKLVINLTYCLSCFGETEKKGSKSLFVLTVTDAQGRDHILDVKYVGLNLYQFATALHVLSSSCHNVSLALDCVGQ